MEGVTVVAAVRDGAAVRAAEAGVMAEAEATAEDEDAGAAGKVLAGREEPVRRKTSARESDVPTRLICRREVELARHRASVPPARILRAAIR